MVSKAGSSSPDAATAEDLPPPPFTISGTTATVDQTSSSLLSSTSSSTLSSLSPPNPSILMALTSTAAAGTPPAPATSLPKNTINGLYRCLYHVMILHKKIHAKNKHRNYSSTNLLSQGISIGFTTHHAIGDGSTLLHFLNAWASINKFNGDAHLLALGDKFSPFYDRSVVEDANGLDARRWDLMKNYRPTVSSIISLPTYKVRATFIMSEADIQKLKSYVIKSLTMADHYKVSSFAAVCVYVWTCFARSAGEVLGDDEAEYFSCPVDCRRRLNPPLPDTYFGNCLAVAIAESTHGILKGTEGFLAAVEAIVKAIDKTVNDENGILDGSDRRLSQLRKMIGKRVVGVAGSPRLDSYGADYRWGRVKKYEVVSIDNDVSISLGKTRDESQASLEIGLSMTKVKMDAFAAAFYQGLTLT
ncbi:hypothetical protein BUALT_Bualt02G0139700 [Buddleja alternifolia]|uniref:Uncharacterized protein n=1 Tax=Buddleja alternifolia TaxID=168488 RepID=A0AAV6Y6T3_9LAMI|nr:hypothetical protein BUALT_Bualt02G0139700 [Buddleja alternifolia]